jgi:hypothetical protein
MWVIRFFSPYPVREGAESYMPFEHLANDLVRELEALNYEVTLTPIEVPLKV